VTDPGPLPAAWAWVDLGTPDVGAAETFYGAVLGWTAAASDDPAYRLALVGGHPVAGLGPAEAPGAPWWTPYLASSDVTADVDRFGAAGGAVLVPPTAAGGAGTFAAVRDPQGAAVSFWQPGTLDGTCRCLRPGTFAGARLCTPDAAASVAFHREALGCAPQIARPAARPAHHAHWIVAFRVPDPRRAAAAALRLGATRSSLDPGCLVDPAGAGFRLVAGRSAAGQR